MVVDAASRRRYHRSRFESRYQVGARARVLPPFALGFLLAYVVPWPLSLEDYGVGTCLSSPRVLSSPTRSRAPRHPSPLSHPTPSLPLFLSHTSYFLSTHLPPSSSRTSSTPRCSPPPPRSPPCTNSRLSSCVEAPSKPHVRPTSHRTLHLSVFSNSLSATSPLSLPVSSNLSASEFFLSSLLASNVSLSGATFHAATTYIPATRAV